MFPKGTGLDEILGDASYEFAAISPSHVYSVDVRCSDAVVSYQAPLWPANKNANTMTHIDQMFRSIVWNPSILPPGEEHTKRHTADLPARDDNASVGLVCITTHTDWICTGSSSGHLHCLDRRTGKLLRCWKGHTKSIEYLKSISRHVLLSVSRDKTAVLWDMTKTPPQKISCIYSELHVPWDNPCFIQPLS